MSFSFPTACLSKLVAKILSLSAIQSQQCKKCHNFNTVGNFAPTPVHRMFGNVW